MAMAVNNVSVLVVDKEKEQADVLADALKTVCADSRAIYSGTQAAEAIKRYNPDVIIADFNPGDSVSGLDILNFAKQHNPAAEVILISANASIEDCKQAIRQGAYDYLVKPVDIGQLRNIIVQAAAGKVAEKPDAVRVSVSRRAFRFDGVVGKNPLMQSIFPVLARVAPTNITVLIEGESGTGKELIAQSIHNNSLRSRNAFRPINCAGLSESLLESELFGHVKGAFTGASEARKGLFEIADKGTLFLDEIGDMPTAMQAKLLRVLEDGIVVPVGSNKQIVVDVRVISATNHNLAELVEQKKFRQDLYFRIKGVSITIPPLRQRTGDIRELANYFLQQANEELGRDIKGISDSAVEILKAYEWPGNIRQLRNTIRTMAVLCDSDVLDVRDIPAEIHHVRRLTGSSDEATALSLNELERQAIVDALAKTENNREKAAKLLGIGERTLYRKIKEYNL